MFGHWAVESGMVLGCEGAAWHDGEGVESVGSLNAKHGLGRIILPRCLLFVCKYGICGVQQRGAVVPREGVGGSEM